jgi:hypothetical protein
MAEESDHIWFRYRALQPIETRTPLLGSLLSACPVRAQTTVELFADLRHLQTSELRDPPAHFLFMVRCVQSSGDAERA